MRLAGKEDDKEWREPTTRGAEGGTGGACGKYAAVVGGLHGRERFIGKSQATQGEKEDKRVQIFLLVLVCALLDASRGRGKL